MPSQSESALHKIKDVYSAHWSELCGFIQSRFGSPPDPEDIAQSSFLKYADALETTVVENPKAFLFRTARNLVVDWYRSPKNAHTVDPQTISQEFEEKSDVSCPELVYMTRQELFHLEKAIMALPERDRNFVLMNRLEDMTYTEIAERAGMSRSGVQKIILQALEKCMKSVRAGMQS